MLPYGEDQALVADFLSDLVNMVDELLKSVLIDVTLHAYRPSMIVSGLFSAALEIKLHKTLQTKKLAAQSDKNGRSPDVTTI